MNTVATETKPSTKYRSRYGRYHATHAVSENIGLSLAAEGAQVLEVRDDACQKGCMTAMYKEEAIEAANKILTHYGIPFCNKV